MCEPCTEKQQAEAQQKEPARWERLCPAVYQETNLGRLRADLVSKGYDDQWLHGVMDWQYGARGLVITGPTGVGKSRVVWRLLRRVLDEERRSALAIDTMQLRSALQSRGASPEEYVRRLLRSEVVYWDDLGQIRLTGPVSEMLLYLVEQRCSASKPILVTTQYTGKQLAAQFERAELGEAVARRLNEFCRVLTVRQVSEQYESPRFSAVKEKGIR
jgi:DNA replication protein DnaC